MTVLTNISSLPVWRETAPGEDAVSEPRWDDLALQRAFKAVVGDQTQDWVQCQIAERYPDQYIGVCPFYKNGSLVYMVIGLSKSPLIELCGDLDGKLTHLLNRHKRVLRVGSRAYTVYLYERYNADLSLLLSVMSER